MSNQFAMVEELASLVKDNLPSKHLLLSVEEALVNFLQDESSGDEILELEPMNPYNRLLLHRLADIFGFAHESVGNGDDRHLILERCPETTIPSILVSDILWQCDEPQPLATSHQLLRRKDAPTVLITNATSCQHTFKEREAAYLTARERIFAVDKEEMREPVTQRPRSVPVVARRMIARALDQKIVLHNHNVTVEDREELLGSNGLSMQREYKISSNSSSEIKRSCDFPGEPETNPSGRAKNANHGFCVSLTERKVPEESVEQKSANAHLSRSGRGVNAVNKEYLEKEHLGAAKRIFAQALGRSSVKQGLHSRGSNSKESVPK